MKNCGCFMSFKYSLACQVIEDCEAKGMHGFEVAFHISWLIS